VMGLSSTEDGALVLGQRDTAQHGTDPCIQSGQGHQTSCQHFRRPTRLSLPVRRDIYTLRNGESPGLRAPHSRLLLSRRGELHICFPEGTNHRLYAHYGTKS
jgi:hypothetical protein